MLFVIERFEVELHNCGLVLVCVHVPECLLVDPAVLHVGQVLDAVALELAGGHGLVSARQFQHGNFV